MKDTLRALVQDAVRDAIGSGEIALGSVPEVELERPRDPSHGDWSTNVAMRSAKAAGVGPRALADVIAGRIAGHADVAAVEVAGPGFINIRLSETALQRVVVLARTGGDDWVASIAGTGVASRSSSSRPTPSARCTSGTDAGPRSATAWPRC